MNTNQKYIDIVFDGPPAPESGRFIEVENETGASIRVGEWVEREDGYWALRLPQSMPIESETVDQMRDRLLPGVMAYAQREGLSEVGIAQAALRIGITAQRRATRDGAA